MMAARAQRRTDATAQKQQPMLKCEDCKDSFPKNAKGRARKYCPKCANKPGRRAGYFRNYTHGNITLAAGSKLKCKHCPLGKENLLVYSGRGAYPEKCEECYRRENAKYMRQRRRLLGRLET